MLGRSGTASPRHEALLAKFGGKNRTVGVEIGSGDMKGEVRFEQKEGLSDWHGNEVEKRGIQSPIRSIKSSDSNATLTQALHGEVRGFGTKTGLPSSPRKKTRSKTLDVSLSDVKKVEVNVQQQYLHELHREFNQNKGKISENAAHIVSYQQQLKDVQEKLQRSRDKERETLERSGKEEIQNHMELEKVHELAYKHINYNKTLVHMLERLHRNKFVIDSRVEELKLSIEDARKELQAHIIRLREAENSERLAKKDLKEVKEQAKAQEAEWTDRLEERREVMAETNEVFEFREKQMATKTAIIAEVQGDLDADGEQKLQRKVITNKMKQLRLANDIAKKTEKIDEFERAFKRIVEATGINNMNQVVEKFLAQNETAGNLKSMIEEANKKIAKLSEEQQRSRKEAEQIRFAGISHTSKQRKIIDEKEADIETAIKTSKQLQERTGFLQSVMRGVQDGITHISKQLDEANVPVASNLTQQGGPNAGSNNNGGPSSPSGLEKEDTVNLGLGGGFTDSFSLGGNGSSMMNGGNGGDGDPSNEDNPLSGDMNFNHTRDAAEFFIENLQACEQRVMKLLETLPSKNLCLDDMDQRLLDRYGASRVMVNMKRRVATAGNSKNGKQAPGAAPSGVFSKAGVKHLLNKFKKGDDPAVKKKQQKAAQMSKAQKVRKHLLVELDKAKAVSHEASLQLQEAERVYKKYKNGKEDDITPEDVLAAEEQLLQAQQATKATAAQLTHIKQQIDHQDEEIAQLLQQQDEQQQQMLQESDISSDESDIHSEESDSDENAVVIVGSEGRELIKAENRKILRFAEKKRKKITKIIQNNANSTALSMENRTIDRDGLVEKEVIQATKLETRKISVIHRPQNRLTTLKNVKGHHQKGGQLQGLHPLP